MALSKIQLVSNDQMFDVHERQAFGNLTPFVGVKDNSW